MSRKDGALLWNRQRIALPFGVTDVDTGLTQVSKTFADQSPNEPILGIISTVSPVPGTLPPSRVHVIPLAPTLEWVPDVTHSEPYFNPMTGTVHVEFTNNGRPVTVNVLFWDPHTLVGPGQADTYNANI